MFKIKELDSEILKAIGTEFVSDLVKISSKDDPSKFCIMPKKFADHYLERIKNMEIFEDDIWIVTFPKCGTTWTQEMAWMINNNLDYETALNVKLNARFPFLEFNGIHSGFDFDSFEQCKNMPRPRHIKSHLPLFLLPDQLWSVNPKIIYVIRNPKDTAVSWYHHHRYMLEYKGTKNDLIKAFASDLAFNSPMNGHVLDFWNIRNQSNVLFLFFEDMKRNLNQEVKKMMKFLDKNYSQDQINKLCQHLSFESIKSNKMVNKDDEIKEMMDSVGRTFKQDEFSFIRQGKVGAYENELSADEIKMLNKYAEDSTLKDAGFEYKFI
ncbi:unnamed protein product [Chironomus riparius]|uniref:Sulfotransferase domain-containing protein n=1 Tax=Chironomus riparius TaxID=315576 RepID=A0A9N9RQT1_9DIPT|nr:unnamed protein product [Chironomus riparius]